MRRGAARMAKARHQGLQSGVTGVGADLVDQVRAHEAGARPGAVADPVDATGDGLQAVVADFQAQQSQMLADAVQPILADGAVGGDHHGVIHVTPVVGGAQAALAEVIEAVEVEVGEGLRHQVADGDARGRRALGEQVQQAQGVRALDDAAHQGGQRGAVNRVEELAHVHVQRPGAAWCATHGGLQPIGGGVCAQAGAAGKVGRDVSAIEQRADDGIDGVLHNEVAERRGFDQAGLAPIVDPERIDRQRRIRGVQKLRVQTVDVGAQVALEQKAAAAVALFLTGAPVGLQQRIGVRVLVEQVSVAFHRARNLLGKGVAAPRVAGLPTRAAGATAGRGNGTFRHQPRRGLPLCRSADAACGKPGSESARNPMLLFELPRTLFRFSAQTPALLPLFQLPPEIAQSMSSPYRTDGQAAGFMRRRRCCRLSRGLWPGL